MKLERLRKSLAREQRLLLDFLAIIGLLTAFGMVASEMIEGETTGFDRTITYLFRGPDHIVPIGPSWLPGSVIDVTALGSVAVLTLISVLSVVFLLTRRRWRHAALVAGALGAGAALAAILKLIFARPRPDLVPHLVQVHSLSFPSGHATDSAIVYLTLAILLARGFEERATRVFIIGTGMAMTIVIGITRIYLGVHYPSDVVAGWALGSAWALAMALLARKLQRHHTIEQPEPVADGSARAEAG